MIKHFFLDIEYQVLHCFTFVEREGSCPHHVVVLCNGHIFRMEPFNKQNELLPAKELER